MLGGSKVRKLLIEFFQTVVAYQLPMVSEALIALKDRSAIPDLERIAGSDPARATEARRVIERLNSVR